VIKDGTRTIQLTSFLLKKLSTPDMKSAILELSDLLNGVKRNKEAIQVSGTELAAFAQSIASEDGITILQELIYE